MDQNSTSQ